MLQFIYYSEILNLFCSSFFFFHLSFIFIQYLKNLGHCFSLHKTKKQRIYEDTSLMCFYQKSLFCIYSGNDVSSSTPLWRHAYPLFCSHLSNDVTIKTMTMMMLCQTLFFPFTVLLTSVSSVASGRATLARTDTERRSRTWRGCSWGRRQHSLHFPGCWARHHSSNCNENELHFALGS